MRNKLSRAPAKVREAVASGDIAAHKAMSSAGGKKAAANRELNTIYKNWRPGEESSFDGLSAEEFRKQQSGEDQLPPAIS